MKLTSLIGWTVLGISWVAGQTLASSPSNGQCKSFKCPGLVLAGNYTYKMEEVIYSKGKTFKINVVRLTDILTELYEDKPIPLLKTYMLIAEMLRHNEEYFQFILTWDLKKFDLQDLVASLIWDFFAMPSKALTSENGIKEQQAAIAESLTQQRLSLFVGKLISSISSDLIITNVKNLLVDFMIKNPNMYRNFEIFIVNLLWDFKDVKDLTRKNILKVVVALEQTKADGIDIEVKNQQDQLLKIIKKLVISSPKLAQKLADMSIGIQTSHELIPSELFKKIKQQTKLCGDKEC